MAGAGAALPAQESRDGLVPKDVSGDALRVLQALTSGNLPAAENEVRQFLARKPESAEPFFWRGYISLRQGKYYDAIRALRQAESVDPNSFVLKALAVSYHGAHQNRLFLIKMSSAQQKQPSDFAPYYYLGSYYSSDENDFSQAAGYLRQAIARQPDHIPSHAALGFCYEQQQQPEQAEAEYRLALRLADAQNSNDGIGYQGLARLRLAANHPEEALPFAQRAVALAPRNSAARKLLARAYSELGRNAEAVTEWKISSGLDPADATTLYRLSRGYQSLGLTREAQAALAQYRKIARLYGTN